MAEKCAQPDCEDKQKIKNDANKSDVFTIGAEITCSEENEKQLVSFLIQAVSFLR